MCGILGLILRDSKVDLNSFNLQLDQLANRGPDGSGVWSGLNSHLVFGHRRLSIIDLSSSASQPMYDPISGLCITFNGEIYNYKSLRDFLKNDGFSFTSESDTEVLLKAYLKWGFDCVDHLVGMFAFSIFDPNSNSVFFARDRSGEKPFFFSASNSFFAFASELKALVNLTPMSSLSVDHVALDCYLSMGFVPKDYCLLNGFNKLPAAHAGVFSLDSFTLSTWQYWEIPLPLSRQDDISLDEHVSNLSNLLLDSISLQLHADVPVGVLLSGGLDSSLITGLACNLSNNVTTFSVSFPGYSQYDESVYSNSISKFYGTRHFELPCSDITCDDFVAISKYVDEPVADSSLLPTYLLCKLVSSQCKVAIGGDGGDELFGGYMHYSRILKLESLTRSFPKSILNPLSHLFSRIIPSGVKGHQYLDAISSDMSRSVPQIYRLFCYQSRKRLLKCRPTLCSDFIRESLVSSSYDLLNRCSRFDFSNYLAEDILVKVDRASMFSSLELRAPFLDHRIVDYCFSSIPSSLKASTSSRKIILKHVAQKILPPDFNYSRKQGFSIPLNRWLISGSIKDHFLDVLLDQNCVFSSSEVLRLFSQLKQGMNHGERIFSLYMLQMWINNYSVSM